MEVKMTKTYHLGFTSDENKILNDLSLFHYGQNYCYGSYLTDNEMVYISLNSEEARRLAHMVQNPIVEFSKEDPKVKKFREKLFNTLKSYGVLLIYPLKDPKRMIPEIG